MRPTLAGPLNPHSTPGRLDFTPFKALPGEKLIPVGRIARVALEEMVVSRRDVVDVEDEAVALEDEGGGGVVVQEGKQTQLLDVPVSVLLFILSAAGTVVDIRLFCSLALVNKRFLWLVKECETTDRMVWRRHCVERWGWLKGSRPQVSWYNLFKRYYLATGPPIFAMEVVFGCDNPLCPMYQCDEACSLCHGALQSWKPGSGALVLEPGQRYLVNVTGGVSTRALAIAVWLYKKGYRGFIWKSKEEYDESGPNIRIRPCY